MAKTSSPEIIDLTLSTPPPELITVVDSDGDDVELVTPNNAGQENGKKRVRRRKKKAKMSSLEGTPRDRSRERDTDRKDFPLPQRSRSPKPRQKSLSPQPRDNFSDLFYVDVEPALIPGSVKLGGLENSQDASKLLLPDHVSVFELGEGKGGPVEIIRPSAPNTKDDEEDFIEYLDFNDQNKGVARYFNLADGDSKPTKFVCKNCGIEGEHKTFECPVQICLTCGARNEHSTRGCPISKTCYSCGMKGHISQKCPNRHSRVGPMESDNECDRCGASIHKTNECPTWWRIYEYVSDDDRLTILRAREEKQSLEFGEGGEGYIGSDEFCYHCGGFGHWGDDCNEVPRLNLPQEPSAFGIHNTMSGPFFDPLAEAQYKAHQRNYDWGPNALPEDWGMSAPGDVGKRGRNKDKANLERRFKEQEANDDADDWFGDKSKAKSRSFDGVASFLKRSPPPAPAKKITFGSSIRDMHQFQPPPVAERPKLLDRIGSVGERTGHQARHNDRRTSAQENYSIRGASTRTRSGDMDYARRGSNHQGWRDRDRSLDRDDGDRDRRRDRDRGRRREEHRPRYKGGYSR